MTEILTVGHSDHPIEDLLAALEAAGVDVLADVRSQPWSRRHPQFRRRALADAVGRADIDYRWMGAALGGRPDDDALRDAAGRPDYDALRRSGPFREALDRLIRTAQRATVAILCAEGDPTRCHRRLLVGDALAERGVTVRHILRDGTVVGEDTLSGGEQLDLLDD